MQVNFLVNKGKISYDKEKIFGKRPWVSRSEEIMNKEEGQLLPANVQEEKSESENKEE